MTESPLSRRQFFGATAATAALAVGTAPAVPVRVSPLAAEPPLPPGVCQRLGSARFRELEGGYRFSPDSKWLAEFDGQGFLGYEVASGRRVSWRPTERVQPLVTDVVWSMSTTDELLAVTTYDGSVAVRRFHLESGRESKVVKVPNCDHAATTPDGCGLIQYDEKGQLWRTDLKSGKTLWKRRWKSDASSPPVVIDRVERWVVGVGAKRLHLFDPDTGNDGPKLEEALPNGTTPEDPFYLLGFSADGKRVAGWHSANVPEQIVVWDLETSKAVGRLIPPAGNSDLGISADGKHLLTADQQSRLVGIDVGTGRITRKLAAENVGGLRLSPDGKVLACLDSVQARGLGGIDGLNNEPGGIIRLLNPTTGELLPQSPDPSAEVTGVRFAGPHTVVTSLASEWNSLAALLWDLRTGRRRMAIGENHPNFGAGSPPAKLAFGCLGFGSAPLPAELSPDGTRWATEFRSRLVVLDAFTGRTLHDLGQPPMNSEGLFWIGRGKVGRFTEAELLVWDLTERTRRVISLKAVPDFAVEHFAVTPDGRTVVIQVPTDADLTATVLAWVDVASGDVSTMPGEPGRLTVSADGSRVAVTIGGDAIAEWEGKLQVTVIDRSGRRTVIHQGSGFNDYEPRAELSPCGRMAFLAHEKKSDDFDTPQMVVQFWEVVSGELRAEYVTAHVAAGLGVSPCGRRVATTHRDVPIYLWDVFGEKSDRLPKPDKKTWDVLSGDADTAFTAVRQLVQHPTAAVELLSAKLTPAEQPKAEWVKARIDRLGSRDFRTRHTAEQELSAVADRIAEPLRKALDAGAESPEAEERLNRLLDLAEGMPRASWQVVRAVEALEYCDVPAAGALLKKLAGGVETAVLTKEAKAAVKRRGERPA